MLTADAKQCSKRRLSLDSGHGTSVADEDTQSHLDTSFSSRLVESGHYLFPLLCQQKPFGNLTWNFIPKPSSFDEDQENISRRKLQGHSQGFWETNFFGLTQLQRYQKHYEYSARQ